MEMLRHLWRWLLEPELLWVGERPGFMAAGYDLHLATNSHTVSLEHLCVISLSHRLTGCTRMRLVPVTYIHI